VPLSEADLIEAIDRALPQTQCTRCEYPACKPYAEAVARNEAPLNRCEPGGQAVIEALAHLTQQPVLPPFHPHRDAHVAWIREEDCIGCARCLPACPVDAILGARRWMHTVITEDCTGCALCIPSCPVECIEMVPPGTEWSLPDPELSRHRYSAHQARIALRKKARTPHEDRAQRRAAMIAEARAAALARKNKSL